MHHPDMMREYDRELLFTQLEVMMKEAMRLRDLYLGAQNKGWVPGGYMSRRIPRLRKEGL